MATAALTRRLVLTGTGLVAVTAVLTGDGRPTSTANTTPPPAPAALGLPIVAVSSDSTGRRAIADFLGIAPARLTDADRDTLWRLERVLIATVADPVASHLDWLWDAQIDAIRRAFEHSGYATDRIRLPDPDLVAPVERAGRVVDAPLATRPGALLFRRIDGGPNGLTLVYLVGETPTEGIHKEAFLSALRERAKLLTAFSHRNGRPASAGVDTLRIIGPTFSGSAASLALALREARKQRDSTVIFRDGKECHRAVRPLVGEVAVAVSGTATSFDVKAQLERSTDPRIAFSATIHPDLSLWSVFEERILEKLGIGPQQLDEVAILAEGSTQYGQTALGGYGAKILRIPFPAGLSQVRTLYESDPALQSNKPAAMNVAERKRLSLGGADVPRFPHDMPSTTPLTPAAVDAFVDQAASLLLESEVRVVVILATDVRDKIFLMRELRRRMGDAQFVVFGSNVLLQRTDWTTALLGAVVLSTYSVHRPIPQGSEFVRSSFSSDGAVGVFNATVSQLGADSLLLSYFGRPGGLPTVLVSIIGRGAAHFLAAYVETVRAPCFMYRPGGSSCLLASNKQSLTTQEVPLGMSNVFRKHFRPSLALALVLAALVAGICWWGSHSAGFVRRAKVKLTEEPDGLFEIQGFPRGLYDWLHLQALAFLFVATLAVVATFAVVVAAFLATWQGGDALVRLGTLALPVAAVVVVGSIGIQSIPRFAGRLNAGWLVTLARQVPYRQLGKLEVLGRAALATFGLVLTIVCFIYARELPPAEDAQLVRLNDLGSLVSPILLVVLAGTWLSFFCLWDFTRAQGLLIATPFERAVRGERMKAVAGPDRTWFQALAGRCEQLRDHNLRLLSRSELGLLLLAGLFLFWWLDRMTTVEGIPLRNPDQWHFHLILRSAVLGLLLVIGWATMRLLSVWNQTESVLEAITGTRIAAFIPEVAKLRQPHRWREFATETRDALTYVPSGWQEAREDPALAMLMPGHHDVDPNVVERKAAITALVVSGAPLAPDAAQTAARYVAAECCYYIEWADQHVRNLVYLLAGALIMGPMLLSAYPFYPEHRARLAFAVLFGAALIAMVQVIVKQNRNELLSYVNRTTAGTISFDSGFMRTVIISVLLPLLSIVASEVPQVGETLLSWAKPLIKDIVK